METLVVLGANVNNKDSDGVSALMYASVNCDKACVEALIEKGAEVNATDTDGVTALMLAAATDRYECV